MKALALKILGAIAAFFAFFNWGKANANKKTAEKQADNAVNDSKKYERISSMPFVGNPCSRMRRKK